MDQHDDGQKPLRRSCVMDVTAPLWNLRVIT